MQKSRRENIEKFLFSLNSSNFGVFDEILMETALNGSYKSSYLKLKS